MAGMIVTLLTMTVRAQGEDINADAGLEGPAEVKDY
jgi:hypothetical protein